MKVLSIEHVSVLYDQTCVVKDLTFSLHTGECLVVMGPNGGGKSSFLHTLALLHTTYTGTFGWKKNHNIIPLSAKEIAYFPQHNKIDRDFPLSVSQVVQMGMWGQKKVSSAQQKQRAFDALCCVGLSKEKNVPIAHLSLGQFQRMLFARMMVQDAVLYILDEPFSAVDEKTTEILMHMLKKMCEKGKMVILAQHSRSFAEKYFDKALLLARTFFCWGPTKDVLTSDNLAKAHETVHLCMH